MGLNVTLNNKVLGNFYPKRFYLCTLEPGKYVFTGLGENEDDLILTTEANKKYYIEVIPRMGFAVARVELNLRDQVTGNAGIQKCRMIGSTLDAVPISSQPVKPEQIQQKSEQPVQSLNQVKTAVFTRKALSLIHI